MLNRMARIAVSAFLALISGSAVLTSAALAKEGDSPKEGITVDNIWDYNGAGAVDAGQQLWFKIPYQGGGLGITMHFRPEDRDTQGAVKAYVETGIQPDVTLGEPGVDLPGYTRIGALSRTENTQEDRTFWFNNQGDPINYYVLVKNNSGHRVPFVLSVNWRGDPVSYILPPIPTKSGTVFASMSGGGAGVPYVWINTNLADSEGQQMAWANVEQLGSGAVHVEMGIWGLQPGNYAIRVYSKASCAAEDLDTTANIVAIANGLPVLTPDEDGAASYDGTAQPSAAVPPASMMGDTGAAIAIYSADGDGVGAPVACGLLQQG